MRAASSVGRVGGLAVAMGIGAGVAIGCADTAWADSVDPSTVSSKSSSVQRSSAGPRSHKAAPAAARGATRSATAAAAARRQPAAKVAGVSAKTATKTSAAAARDPIAATFFNETPTLSWNTNPGQSSTGVVTGMLNATDADGDPLSYTVTTGPNNGTVSVGGDGSYTYTPFESHAYDGTVDSFTVTASDAGGGFHLHGIAGLLNLLTFGLFGLGGHTSTVTVGVNVAAWKKYNTDPTASYSVGSPDPTTGAVLGQIDAVDAEDDPLTYTATIPAKGSVTFTADGGFTYTPNDVARHAAARDWVTDADLYDSFTVTISDGRGGSVSGPIDVPIGPKNDAPVAGTPSVGSPVGSAGVITGSVAATDADGDSLTYSGSGTTTKGTVTIDARTGAFTYTPKASAHGMAATTDTFTIVITDGYGGSTPVAVSVPIAALVVGNSMIRYSFNYTSGSQYWTPEAMNALQFAADKIASYIVVSQPVTLTFDVAALNSPSSSTLASAGSNLAGWGVGYRYTLVQNKLLTGLDYNGASADGSITVNFGTPWAYGDTVGFDQHDFVSVLMHEMMHAYGFISAVVSPGTNVRTLWPLFTSGIYDMYGNKLIDSSTYRFNTTLDPNLTGNNGGLYFGGAHAVNAYGGLVPLYTPFLWSEGSSVGHLDDYTFWGTQLMEALSDTGPRVRVLSSVEQGILQDLGYTISAPAWSSALFIGFGFFIRRRKAK